MAAALRAKSDTAARARRDRRRQRMMPRNSADRSVGRDWVTQCLPASKRPPSAKVKPPPLEANAAVHFLSMMVRAPRAAHLLANSPERGAEGDRRSPPSMCAYSPQLRPTARNGGAPTTEPIRQQMGRTRGLHHHGEEMWLAP